MAIWKFLEASISRTSLSCPHSFERICKKDQLFSFITGSLVFCRNPTHLPTLQSQNRMNLGFKQGWQKDLCQNCKTIDCPNPTPFSPLWGSNHFLITELASAQYFTQRWMCWQNHFSSHPLSFSQEFRLLQCSLWPTVMSYFTSDSPHRNQDILFFFYRENKAYFQAH